MTNQRDNAPYHHRGTSRRKMPVTNYNDLLKLPYREIKQDRMRFPLPHCQQCEDDQRALNTTGSCSPHQECAQTSPRCPDCKRGTLQWAEAGYTPWHRICDTCGSHWSLHLGPAGYIERAGFYRCV